ncbi:hypothetical protein P389DRAFT_193381 [Cystobasidium minutum MCA 4210]|uniref:uncharacterized protein n=1 Tax=Cystobasidium minutum MCA 4210 TaxID=1397322 RepID=UPI0034CE87F0|eukprot:jgi/Rhomi1/193381/gm1.1595_g
MVGPRPTLQGGQIHITVVTPDKVDEAAKVIRVHEIHNETLCSITSYIDGSPVSQAAGDGNEGQHPYDTSPYAQEHQNEARSSAIGGTIIIEIHNETRLIENRYFTSRSKNAADATAGADTAKKRKATSVKVKKGSASAPKKARLAIEAAKPPSASSISAAAREARQQRRSAGQTSGEESVVGGLP